MAQQNQHIYNHKGKPDIQITDQISSGRCWIFAALNVIRRHFMKKYNLLLEFVVVLHSVFVFP